MLKFLPVPFVIYWLVVKDFLYDLDICDNNFNETGYCLSNLQCSNIVKGKNIGPCDSETSGSVCCKITLNLFNETYLLNPIFARKSQTETIRKMTIISSDTCSQYQIQHGNKTIFSNRKKKMVSFDPDLHVSKSPDKILWAIYASFSRESRDLRKQSSGQNYLYAVTLDKLDADETVTSNCQSESDTSEDNFYTMVNPAEYFPIRKFFTPEIQKLNTMNLTLDVKSLFEVESDKRSRRSIYHRICEEKDSTCRKQGWEDIIKVEEEIDIIQSRSETDHDIHEDLKVLEEHENISSVHKYVLESKSLRDEIMENKDMNAKLSDDEENKDGTLQMLVTESIYDASKRNANEVEEKQTFKLIRPPVSVKGNSDSVKGDTTFDGDLQTDVDDKIKPVDNSAIHNLKESVPIETSHYISYPVQVEAVPRLKPPPMENHMRKSVEFDETHDLKPVQTEDAHDLRIPVQTEATHDLRKVVQKESTHDMRIPVQIDTSHNMRKPIQNERESVKNEVTHDLRKPVTSDESHDLRWPVLEGETDLRSLGTDSDKIEKSRPYYSGNEKIYNLCTSVSSSTENMDNSSGKKQNHFNDIWKEASRVCGKYSEDATENSRNVNEKWPWMVSLHEKKAGNYYHKCSASLLNGLWVITVAHCVDMKPKSDFKLVLGSQNPEHDKEKYTEMDIDEIVIHPKFNRGLFENDIALLRMRTAVAFQSTISPICLPWSVGELQYGTPVFLGWDLKHQRNSGDLKERTIPLMSNSECEILYSTGKNKEKIKDTFLCAAKDDENCNSESGSSLIALDAEERWSLIGLVSWGSMCTNPEQPGVYVRISSYAQWIKDVIDCYENLL